GGATSEDTGACDEATAFPGERVEREDDAGGDLSLAREGEGVLDHLAPDQFGWRAVGRQEGELLRGQQRRFVSLRHDPVLHVQPYEYHRRPASVQPARRPPLEPTRLRGTITFSPARSPT